MSGESTNRADQTESVLGSVYSIGHLDEASTSSQLHRSTIIAVTAQRRALPWAYWKTRPAVSWISSFLFSSVIGALHVLLSFDERDVIATHIIGRRPCSGTRLARPQLPSPQ